MNSLFLVFPPNITLIIKQILLGNAAVGGEDTFIKGFAVIFINNPFYPDIFREGRKEGKSEKQGAVGHLGTHPFYCHQILFSVIVLHFRNPGKVDFPG